MLSLSRELAGRGHLIFLLHDRDGSMLADYREFAQETLSRPLPGFAMRSPGRTVACVLSIGRIARQLDVDVILSSHLGFIRHCALVRTFAGIPACFHLGLPFTGANMTIRMANARVGAGVAPSAHTTETWRQGGWTPSALHHVRNWVDASRFRPAPDRAMLRRQLGLPTADPCVVFVGRVCEQKGVDVLIRAFSGVSAVLKDVTLVIVGPVDASFLPRLKKSLGELDETARQRVIQLPPTSTPEKYYSAADVACAPSLRDESFGLTVLEAMACGVPVVTTDVGIIPEILGSHAPALVVPAGNVEALTETLIHWLDSPAESSALGVRLRQRVLDEYGPAPSVTKYENILAGIAPGPALSREN